MVREWFNEWVAWHIQLCQRADWQPLGSPFWTALQEAFVRHGVTQDVAFEATRRVREAGSVHPDGLEKAILDAAKRVWSEAGGKHDPTSREAAEAAARNCSDCGGKEGLTLRYRHASRREGRPDAVVFYCRCATGRWVERNHRQGSKDIHARIPDLERYPDLWGERYREPPDGPIETMPPY